ncbi:MAG: ATP-binding protein [Actinobacteria bacterium]|jgi:SpoVK/Ycf46/Vps4 family AAA+-type ATPase|nr:ATP-binding protein [Actinomycetota bacterium]
MTGHGHGHDDEELPAGITAVVELPDPRLRSAWERMVLPAGVKTRLCSWAVLALEHGHRLTLESSGLQRLLLLSGPPGTGKSTTARGLADAAVRELGGDGLLIEVDPHALPSDLLGQSQRNVVKLLRHTLPAVSAGRRAVVLVDEVEAFATRRSSASFDTNPADLHRATDAVLAGLDHLASELDSLLVVATTNFATAVDEAMLSRADWTVEFAYPDAEAAARIVQGSLTALAQEWPSLAELASDAGLVAKVADRCAGHDGRTLAKLGTLALSLRPETARDPGRLTAEDVLDAADLVVSGTLRERR